MWTITDSPERDFCVCVCVFSCLQRKFKACRTFNSHLLLNVFQLKTFSKRKKMSQSILMQTSSIFNSKFIGYSVLQISGNFLWTTYFQNWKQMKADCETWAKNCANQLIRKPSPLSICLSVVITFEEINFLKLKGNPGHFGKHVDGAAGLRVQVQIELHHVWLWRLQVLRFHQIPSLFSVPVFSSELHLPLLWGSAIYKWWQRLRVNSQQLLSSLIFGLGLTKQWVSTPRNYIFILKWHLERVWHSGPRNHTHAHTHK